MGVNEYMGQSVQKKKYLNMINAKMLLVNLRFIFLVIVVSAINANKVIIYLGIFTVRDHNYRAIS